MMSSDNIDKINGKFLCNTLAHLDHSSIFLWRKMNLWAERSLNNWVESAFILKLDFMSKAVFFIFFRMNSNSADNVLKK
jgi:hypothetical protein